MSTLNSERSAIIKRCLCFVLMICSVILSFYTAWTVPHTLLDSDASSELVLGEKLSREGGIISPTWYYSTEIKVIDNHLVYAPLFRLTSDWSDVRFIGSIVMNLMLLAAYGYLAWQAGISLNFFLIGGAALLLPFSVPWGRIVLYHNYYSFHISLQLLTTGLWLSVQRKDHKRNGRPWSAFRIVILLVISFLAGLGGVRHLMITAAPIVMTSILDAVISEKNEQSARSSLSDHRSAIGWAFAVLVSCAAGYLFNTCFIQSVFSFADYSRQSLLMEPVEELTTINRGLLSAIGFQDIGELFTPHGLLSIGSMIALLCTLFLSVHTLFCSRDREARYLQLVMLSSLIILFCVFLFLGSTDYSYELYLLHWVVWVLPALSRMDLYRPAALQTIPVADSQDTKRIRRPAFLFSDSRPASAHSMLALVALLLMIAHGVFYSAFFRHPGEYADKVRYAGLNYESVDTVENMAPIAQTLQEKGYTLCYTSYWDAAIITELTDGHVRSCPIVPGRRKHPLQYYNWLSDGALRNPDFVAKQKTCILASAELNDTVEGSDLLMEALIKVDNIGGYTIYEFKDPAWLANNLS